MRAARAGLRDDLVLIAGTVLATLAVHRHVSNLAGPRKETSRSRILPSPDAPLEKIPADNTFAKWKNIALRTYQRINDDRLLATAAGVVFYGLLAIFPAITAVVSSYALFADPSTIGNNLRSLATLLPEGSFAIVQDQIERVLAKGASSLGVTFAVGLLIAIWSANAGMKALLDALNVAYEEREKRGVIRLNLVSLSLTTASLAGILIMIGGVVVVPSVLHLVGFEEGIAQVVWIGRWPLLAVLLLLGLAVLYRFGPSRAEPRWQWLSVGALIASVLWLICSSLLSWYLSNFANYTATYGALGAAIGLMIWMWMSAIIVLSGAELNAEIESQATAPLVLHRSRQAERSRS
jgi:membrane protein